MVDEFLFFTTLVSGITLTSFSVYYVVCMADIMFDFVDIDKGCKKMNRVVFLEVMLISYIPFVLGYTSHWILSALIIPLTVHTLYRCLLEPGIRIKYTPNSIKDNDRIKCFLRESFVKILLHLIMSLVILYHFIVSVLS